MKKRKHPRKEYTIDDYRKALLDPKLQRFMFNRGYVKPRSIHSFAPEKDE